MYLNLKEYKKKLNAIKVSNIDSCILFLICIENNLDYHLVKIESEDFNKLRQHKIIYKNDINDLCVNIKTEIDQDIESNLEKYREIFDGIRKGSKGKKRLVISNLKKFFSEYPEYTMDEVIEAAYNYVRNNPLPRNADYFIYKTIKKNGKNVLICEIKDILDEISDNTFSKSIYE